MHHDFTDILCIARKRLRLGSIDVVIITDFETTKEAFAKDALMGRPPDLPFEHNRVTVETGAFIGMPWKEQRRFSLHMLRDLGFGKTRMEDHIKEEILELLERISDQEGKSVKHAYLLAPSMSNNIVSLVFGKRLKYNDPERQRLDYLVREIGRLAGFVSWQIFFPWLGVVMSTFNIGNKGRLVKVIREMGDYCRKQIQEHEATLDPNNIRDFMDSYLLEIKKKSDDPNTSFRKEVLEDISRLFFGAGSETVRVTVDWMLLVCAAYPEVQKKVHSEIDEVIGKDCFPTRNDHLSMPFTEAAIAELMRWKTIIPLNIMRYTLQDTELKGYFIPKHTRVLSVTWAVDHDTELWGKDVHEYKPERFLSQDGSKVVKPEYAIPFSIGKRSCPGKSLAEIEVFLYLVAILQKFEVQPPPGKQIDLEGQIGISLQPKKQEICFKRRH
ncbi:Cytochrome P450 2J2 [Araneus ventricosus]|uniref:Cytochrome P450 2J2 n=1 Tax=Araneus ventricosus TaxID=182803 RepID=A0A4Y2SYW8_ARAVE|nr:Cytochrome P450 2J2 [Araneus ventricosus]